MSQPTGKPAVYRIAKGAAISHFHERCPEWPRADYYEQDKPLWWGEVCPHCGSLADEDSKGTGWPENQP